MQEKTTQNNPPAPKPTRGKNCRKQGCKSWPLASSEYCFAHDPAKIQERAAARRKGGQVSSSPKILAEAFSLQTISDVKDMLGRTTNTTLKGEIDLNRARVAGYLASLIMTCLKDYDLEKRMEAIEGKLAEAESKSN
jgi:hypothetical protein